MRFRQIGNVSIADEREIVAYDIVTGDDSSIVGNVETMISEGWQPFESLAVAVLGSVVIYVQPVVKYAEDRPASSP